MENSRNSNMRSVFAHTIQMKKIRWRWTTRWSDDIGT